MTAIPLDRRAILVGAAATATFGCSPKGVAETTEARPVQSLLTRAIPSSGAVLPIVGLGTWQAFDLGPGDPDWPQARDGLAEFHRLGGRVVDSSPMYGRSEESIGALSTARGINRDLFIATKVWTTGREAGIAQMKDSMRKLGRSRIDLMQVHNLVDAETHLATLDEWKSKGVVDHVGVTHYDISGYAPLERVMRAHPLDAIQINYSAAETEAEARILPLAKERGMAVLINRPFAGGEVFSRLRREPLPGWAAEIGAASWAQVLLKFVLSHPAATCAIPGTRNPRYIADNLGAAVGAMPDAKLRRRIAEAVKNA